MKLSIITVNYNNASGLEETVRSILSQSHKEFEYIVIDGGSTDGSEDILIKYSDKIDYWVSEPDAGIFNAMNKGIKQAKGEYLLFMNSGDIINQDCGLIKIIDDLNDEDIIYYDIRVIGKEQNLDFIKYCPEYLDFKFFVESALPHQSTFIKKNILDEYGGYAEYMKLGGDWAFFTDAICIKEWSYRHVAEYFSTFFLDGASSEPSNFALLWEEKNEHIRTRYKVFSSFYEDWISKRQELYKLKTSVSVRYLKKLGFLKWLKL
jgi:glycosyltransferase involved in cell wall biosynthesis